jgi:dipeptidyl aminopeptidase/acylaminoacyl peptidase
VRCELPALVALACLVGCRPSPDDLGPEGASDGPDPSFVPRYALGVARQSTLDGRLPLARRPKQNPRPIPGVLSPALPEPPDSRIVFAKNEAEGQVDLYTIRPDGSDLVRLTDTPEVKRWPRWSPDGRTIAFEKKILPNDFWDRSYGLLDVATRTELPFPILASAYAPPEASRGRFVGHVAWSPDGSRLMFGLSVDFPFSTCGTSRMDGCSFSNIGWVDVSTGDHGFALPRPSIPGDPVYVWHSPMWTTVAMLTIRHCVHTNCSVPWREVDDVSGGRLVDAVSNEYDVSPVPGGLWLTAELPYRRPPTIYLVEPFAPYHRDPRTGEWTWGISLGVGRSPRWSPTGNRIVYVKDDGIYVRVPGEITETRIYEGSVDSLDW